MTCQLRNDEVLLPMDETTETQKKDTIKEIRPVRFARRIEEHPYTRLLAVLGIYTALIAFALDFSDRMKERNDRQEERVARAWQILGTTAPGNSGKREALETLFNYNQELSGLNLSCEVMNGTWQRSSYVYAKRLNCQRGAYLKGLDLYQNISKEQKEEHKRRQKTPALKSIRPNGFLSSNLNGVDLEGANFKGLLISSTTFEGANLQNTNFHNANLDSVSFRFSKLLEANLSETRIKDADLSEAGYLKADFSSAYIGSSSFERSNILRAKFTNSVLADVDFSRASLALTDFSNAEFRDFSSQIGEAFVFFYKANISATNFENSVGLLPKDFKGAFSLKSTPPTGLSKQIMDTIILCDKEYYNLADQIYRYNTDEIYLLNKDCELFEVDNKTGNKRAIQESELLSKMLKVEKK